MIEILVQYLDSILSIRLFKLGNTEISLITIFQISLATFLVLFLSRTTRYLLERRILTKFNIDAGIRASISILISYFIGAFGFILIIQTMGFDFSSIFVIIGGLGVGIGFGLQQITNNFISGITILLEQKLKVGDFIDFEEVQGNIQEISLRTTTIRTPIGQNVVIPNGNLIEKKLVNWTHESQSGYSLIHLKIEPEYNPLLVTEILIDSASRDPLVSHRKPPKVFFNGYQDGFFQFELIFWLEDFTLFKEARSSLHYTVEYNLRQAGIYFPDDNERKVYMLGDDPKKHRENVQGSKLFLSSVRKNNSLYIKDHLKKVEYFQNFNELELRRLIEYGYRKTLEPSEILFREGDYGDAFYVILSGTVEIYTEKMGKTLATLNTGSFFGELSLLLGIPRTASVKALEKTTVFFINNQGFKRLLEEQPTLQEEIAQQLSERREELKERQRQLREMGLVDDREDDRNPVVWVRKRLTNLFGSSSDASERERSPDSLPSSEPKTDGPPT
ncbi:MAG: mechanosensitive ion channel [Cyanobacteria bacterium SBLK]|nr:mechanosensitive ion channel [Cyanobacteria bacterium SBLK]